MLHQHYHPHAVPLPLQYHPAMQPVQPHFHPLMHPALRRLDATQNVFVSEIRAQTAFAVAASGGHSETDSDNSVSNVSQPSSARGAKRQRGQQDGADSLGDTSEDSESDEPATAQTKKARTTASRKSAIGTHAIANSRATKFKPSVTRAHTDTSSALPPATSSKSKPEKPKPQRGTKGLRHFAILLCLTLAEMGQCSYTDIADTLITESKRDIAIFNGTEGRGAYEDKNIRRRIYDALNVLISIGVIAKQDKKTIRWAGPSLEQLKRQIKYEKSKNPKHNHQHAHASRTLTNTRAQAESLIKNEMFDQLETLRQAELQREINERTSRIEEKRALLTDEVLEYIGMRYLLERNTIQCDASLEPHTAEGNDASRSVSTDSSASTVSVSVSGDDSSARLYFPFLLINTAPSTTINCEIADDHTAMSITYSDVFSVHDQAVVVRMIGKARPRMWDHIPTEVKQFVIGLDEQKAQCESLLPPLPQPAEPPRKSRRRTRRTEQESDSESDSSGSDGEDEQQDDPHSTAHSAHSHHTASTNTSDDDSDEGDSELNHSSLSINDDSEQLLDEEDPLSSLLTSSHRTSSSSLPTFHTPFKPAMFDNTNGVNGNKLNIFASPSLATLAASHSPFAIGRSPSNSAGLAFLQSPSPLSFLHTNSSGLTPSLPWKSSMSASPQLQTPKMTPGKSSLLWHSNGGVPASRPPVPQSATRLFNTPTPK